jgi:hypothetical protein
VGIKLPDIEPRGAQPETVGAEAEATEPEGEAEAPELDEGPTEQMPPGEGE